MIDINNIFYNIRPNNHVKAPYTNWLMIEKDIFRECALDKLRKQGTILIAEIMSMDCADVDKIPLLIPLCAKIRADFTMLVNERDLIVLRAYEVNFNG